MSDEIKQIMITMFWITLFVMVTVVPTGLLIEDIKHERKIELERARAEHVLTFIREWRK